MKQTTSRVIQDALKYIHEIYGFMFERGYEVFSAEEVSLGWQVVLSKPDLFVKILRIRGEEDVMFRTSLQPPDEFTDIGSVVYAATGEKILIAYDSYSKDLLQYLDQIERYFESEYVKHPDRLRAAQKQYRETLPKVEAISPKEPGMIPILHYPLMGMIILLIFGALTTLYMVLLDRLLSVFSLNADLNSWIAGVGSLLLAIGTMLIFRRLTKKG